MTQCAAAASPTQTWTAIVARERGLNLTCFGFGGQCHIEPMVARLIRDLPADYISLCLGINVYGARSLTARTFRPAVLGFIAIVRERHPDIPLVVISPIVSAPRETEPNQAGLSLALMRQEIAEAVEALRAHGDEALHYVDGLRIFGPDLQHLQPDQVHPDAEGYRVLARNFLREVAVPHFNIG
ncbi:MAG TPA: GDSL-type esterase/lipase family protein [Chloroflexota bacterium]|nr:GDSL-type esterase/lipase family protein [Chloroflexota bacterium]